MVEVELDISDGIRQRINYVICVRLKCDSEFFSDGIYDNLKEAKQKLKELVENNPYNNEYKIRKTVITSADIITDKMLPLLNHRETCDCFYCGKMIEAGDELVFGDSTEEVYCSHECASMAQDNERMTLLKVHDEYLHWFMEVED